MRIFKAILVYLFIGCILGIVSASAAQDKSSRWPLLFYSLISGYLIFLFFRGRPNLIFGSLVLLFLIQLVSAETHSFSYLFTIGLYFILNFGIGGSSHNSTILGLSASDFSTVPAGEPVTIGFNLLALVFLLLVIVNRKK